MLLDAFARFKKKSGAPHRLVLAGANVHGLDLAGLARRGGVEDAVLHRAGVDDEDLNALYHSATAVVSPGVRETMSLPVLEAQAAGAPVVCADAEGTAEFTGGHAVAAAAPTAEALAEALQHVAEDPGLRAELSERGRAHSARFTWERTSRAILDVLSEAAGLAGGREVAAC
jgi:glycosyltransferase involved in cell wall biosynthesis